MERTLSDMIAYPGVQEWWEQRKHWHTEEFGRVVDAIIARGDEPKAFSAFNLRELVGTKTRHMNDRAELDEFAERYARACCSQSLPELKVLQQRRCARQ